MKDIKLNGPAEFDMHVFVVNDETGQEGKVTVCLGALKYPTRKDIAERIAKVPADLEEQGMEGFRLASKEEAFRAWSIERTGQQLACPGGPEWDDLI